MKSFNLTKFCADLVELRKDATQAIVAEKLGINRSTLSLLETGKQIPSLEILTKVCDYGNYRAIDYFFDDENDGLIYLMGTLMDNDMDKIKDMMDNIKIKEKYEMLSRRCS